jgi:hypothetical protein
MPAISRSSVDLPAPLCPTSATRSPLSQADSVMSRSASMIGTLLVGADPAARLAQHGLLQRPRLGVEDREVDGGAVDPDVDAQSRRAPHTQYATRER